MKLKGEMSMLNVLHLQELDVEVVCAELQQKRDEAPQFFTQSPVVVDCSELGEAVTSFDFSLLKRCLLALGFIPVGIRNAPAGLHQLLADNGWAVMRNTATHNGSHEPSSAQQENQPSPVNQKTTESVADKQIDDVSDETSEMEEQAPPPSKPVSVTIERPVRSGQQVYAADADMTLVAPTSAGSEVVADGSIHAYGALRGRVLAGARGNVSARIFCQALQAELIAIAGRYLLLDESDTPLKGKPAMIRLEGEKLIIEPLG